jgi:hypothetical protein
LTEDYKFKLKGTGLIKFHLECDFFRDKKGVSCFAPRKYIDKLIASCERMFGSKPKTNKITSPLVKGDHPEIDDYAFLEEEGIQQYQSLIGQLQWAILLGRFDIAIAIMTMSAFRTAPRKGHLDGVKRICGYLSKMRIQPFESALKDQIILIFQGRNTTGNSLSTEVQRKRSKRIYLSRWASLLSLQLMLMLTYTIVC